MNSRFLFAHPMRKLRKPHVQASQTPCASSANPMCFCGDPNHSLTMKQKIKQ